MIRGGKTRLLLLGLCLTGMLAVLVAFPALDLAISRLFYVDGLGFPFSSNMVCLTLRDIAFYGGRILAFALLALTILTYMSQKIVLGLDKKAWAFLTLCLVIGPGLIANVAFKDHWGRARPREVAEFGGTANFSPALIPQVGGHKNSAFISGDASFGFMFHALGFVVPRRISRRTFWAGIAAGGVFGLNRLIMGAHFLSDILFAAFFMLLTAALIHSLLYGRKKTLTLWNNWVFSGSR